MNYFVTPEELKEPIETFSAVQMEFETGCMLETDFIKTFNGRIISMYVANGFVLNASVRPIEPRESLLESFDVEVDITFRISNFSDYEALLSRGISLDEYTKEYLGTESLYGLVDDDYTIRATRIVK